MHNTELEYTLNSLSYDDKNLFKEIYDYYTKNRMDDVIKNSDFLSVSSSLSLYNHGWKTIYSELNRLEERGLLHLSKSGEKINNIALSDQCLDNMETITRWVNTPSLKELADMADQLALQAEKARQALLLRTDAVYMLPYGDIKSISEYDYDEYGQPMCTITMDYKGLTRTAEQVDEVSLPLAVVNSSNPAAAYLEMQRRNAEKDTPDKPANVKKSVPRI
jgi:hypothetical protein